LDDDMPPAPAGGDALFGMKTGRTADRDDVHRFVIEERIERVVGRCAVRLGQPSGALHVAAVDRDDLHAGDGRCGARMRLADVPCAEDTDVHWCFPPPVADAQAFQADSISAAVRAALAISTR